MCVDYLFFITLSRQIRFVTAQSRPRRTAKLLCNALRETVKLYKRAGFIVLTFLMDNEFEPIKEMMSDTLVINTTAKNKHRSVASQWAQDPSSRDASI